MLALQVRHCLQVRRCVMQLIFIVLFLLLLVGVAILICAMESRELEMDADINRPIH